GLALTIFGTGLSGTLGIPLAGLALPDSILRAFSAYNVPGLSKIPVLGEMFFQQSVYVQIKKVPGFHTVRTFHPNIRRMQSSKITKAKRIKRFCNDS
ncbi:hypothetical protein NE463_20865, partial [Anaerotruncus colihominis]|nr:hypothetical protein [Anaerotruncus colihominis]